MTQVTDPEIAPADETVAADANDVPIVDESVVVDDRPCWRRMLAAVWRSLRPDGAASWRHAPRGA